MTATTTVNQTAFSDLVGTVDRLNALLLALDEAAWLHHLDVPAVQRPSLLSALLILEVARDEGEAAARYAKAAERPS